MQHVLVGIVGRHVAGKRLDAPLRALGASTQGVVFSRDTATIPKTPIIVHHQHLVRLDREEAPATDGRPARKSLDRVLGRRGRYDVLVVSDYGKGAVAPELLGALAEAHRRTAFAWLVDPKRANCEHRLASLGKPNRKEAAASRAWSPVTAVGARLRATSSGARPRRVNCRWRLSPARRDRPIDRRRLDEPQLWNVLRDDMSFVGPRSERPEFVERFARAVHGYAERQKVRPGLTGYAQVNGEYHTSAATKLKYDLAYIYNRSLWLDFKILSETVKVMLTRRGV